MTVERGCVISRRRTLQKIVGGEKLP